MSHLPQVHRGGASQLLAVIYVLTACCDSPPLLCLLRLTNPGVPHGLSAGRCLGTVWYHCGITMTMLQCSAPTQALLILPLSLQVRFCKVGYVLLRWPSAVAPG